jgi:hypothetical protein
MLPLNFDAPALEKLSVQEFVSTPLRVSFMGDASLRVEG